MSNNPNIMLTYYCDNKRHLVCKPYSIKNLHIMAEVLGIKRHWFHRTHYDIPLKRIKEITVKCIVVSPKKIVEIIKPHFSQRQFMYKNLLTE